MTSPSLRSWIVIALLFGACKNTHPPDPPEETYAAPSALDAHALAPTPPPAPAGPAFTVPDAVGLPAPFDKLRPFMKRTETLAKLGTLVEATASLPVGLRFTSPDAVAYALPTPGTYFSLTFDADRLVAILMLSTPAEVIAVPAHAKWGNGRVASGTYAFETTETWPPGATGWTTALGIGPSKSLADLYAMNGPGRDPLTFAELTFRAGDPGEAEAPARDAPSAGPPLASIAKLIGRPLPAATTLLGDALHVEIADDQPAVAEADHDQGYARVKFPWSDDMWEVAIRLDAKSQRIAAITLSGAAAAYAGQVALMNTLEAAFGARKPVLDEVGDPEIGFGSSAVRAVKDGSSWSIEISR